MNVINHYRKLKVNCLVSLVIIFLCGISCNALGVSLAAKQKYPFTLLTDDYGILNEHDLSFYIPYLYPAPCFLKEGSSYIYWQCFPPPDGKMRATDCANTEGVLRIIQSIPSPKAEPFKRWLVKVGYERIQEIEDPELAQERMKQLYEQKGYPKKVVLTTVA